jgi:hydroxymethylpyrimidine kinase/phosphomethylpyrimidine kinase
MTNISGAILAIAGSDPSGGAGIQADLKTYASLGVYGCAAISCLTVQNSKGVYAIQAVAPELVKEQIRKVLADLPVSHIKTGMIGTGAVAKAIGECLADFNGVVVCDPVLKASDGHDLLTAEGLDCLSKHVISQATALTPNFTEFQALTGLDSDSDEAIATAAAGMFTQYPRLQAIIVKGGHRNEDQPVVIDSLFIREDRNFKIINAKRARNKTANTHGTGCTYASALAAYHLKTRDWPQAFRLAGDYVAKLLRLSADRQMGHGTGPLWHHLFKESNNR